MASTRSRISSTLPVPEDSRILRRVGVAACGPARVVVDQLLGLIVIDLQPLAHGVFLVVVALNQIFAGGVVLARDLRPIEVDVIGAARSPDARRPDRRLMISASSTSISTT